MAERKMVSDKSKSSYFLCLFCSRFRKRKNKSIPCYDDESQSSEPLIDLQTKPGWKATPYILGNEVIERMATYGITTNMMVYLVREYHMDQVVAANILTLWTCAYCLLTLVGALVADIFLGKFLTIAFASFSSLLGMVTITLTASVPQLRPPPCILIDKQQHLEQCTSNTKAQLGFLLMGLAWLAIGTGGIRPCGISFGIDQFDPTTVEGRKATNSYLNWYYTSNTVVLLINQTLLVYIQDSVSWALGFGIPTLLMMLCAIPLFWAGSKIYVHAKPQGSTFFSFAQVLVASYKKRHLKLHNDHRVHGVFYDASSNGNVVLSKLPLSTQSSFLKKAALIVDNELNHDGSCANPWRLCTIQQVEEVLCVIKSLPIWASGAICLMAYVQQATFIVSQALKMDRHLGPNKFQIPAGSVQIMSLTTMTLWLPLYDRVLQPALRKVTKHEDGIPTLQRIGIGYLFSILSMVVSGLVEQQRRALANSPNGVGPMSVFWLFPQLVLIGLFEVFSIVGHIEFYSKEFPEKMRSFGTSLVYLCAAVATYLSSLVMNVVHSVTGKHGKPNWLDNDINAGRLDYFYFLISGLGVLNFVYFLYCARGYTYKASVKAADHQSDIIV